MDESLLKQNTSCSLTLNPHQRVTTPKPVRCEYHSRSQSEPMPQQEENGAHCPNRTREGTRTIPPPRGALSGGQTAPSLRVSELDRRTLDDILHVLDVFRAAIGPFGTNLAKFAWPYVPSPNRAEPGDDCLRCSKSHIKPSLTRVNAGGCYSP